MVLIIDNYDSFVYNLSRYFQMLGFNTQVVRNNKITLDEIAKINPSHLILSPGPCTPNEAGICIAAIHHFAGKIPILGVCLGHQAIAQAFGGKITKALKPVHGKQSLITHDQTGIFHQLPNPLMVGRYHSLIVDQYNFPKELKITATSEKGEIMAIQHSMYPIIGVQFHPESILTEHGFALLENFLKPIYRICTSAL